MLSCPALVLVVWESCLTWPSCVGFVGGSVLQAILAHPKANTFEITALVRSEAKAHALESTLGIKTVIGSLQDYALLTENAAKAHLVFQIVSDGNLNATRTPLCVNYIGGCRL